MASLVVAYLGDVQVNESGVERGVAEILADLANGDAAFEQVGGEGMTKRMSRKGFFNAASGAEDAHGQLDRGNAHRFFAPAHRLGQREVAFFPEAPDGGEKPLAVLVEAPVVAQPLDHGRGDGNLARLASLALADAHHPAGGVDVGGPQRNRFAQAQAAMIDQSQDGLETVFPHRGEDPPYLGAGQDDRQGRIPADGKLVPELPVQTEEVAVKHPQGDQGLIERGGPQLVVIAQVQQIVEDLPLANLLEGAFREVAGEEPNPSQVGRFCARPQRLGLDEDEELFV